MSESPRPIDRASLVSAIATFLADRDAGTLRELRRSVELTLDDAGPEAMADLGERLAQTCADWNYYAPDPLARRLHHVLAERLLAPGSTLTGIENAAAVEGRPVVIVANHLSYSDANLFEVLLRRSGGGLLADRLTVMAGPKVYSSLRRRFSSLCFGTIKTPQNTSRSTEGAVMNVRDVARAARRVIDIAHQRLALGEALLVFPEGTRSRTHGMQRTLGAVARYLEGPAAAVLPVGITGSEAMFPIGDERLHSVRIVARVGEPLDGALLRDLASGDRRLLMDVVGLTIAALLPAEYRGEYADDAQELDDARAIALAAAARTSST
jgi:1-acyl-sn-glycerol-3-phosphate acyltransferase